MKKLLTLMVMAVAVTLGSAQAQVDVPNLGRPETLVAEAQNGRKELLEVLLRLKDNVRELRDQPTFDEFFAILPELDKLAVEQNLSMIYPNAVLEVGKSMIMHGNRWLKISLDNSDKILSYQKYADLTAALQFQGQVVEELNKIKDEKLFKKAYVNLLALEAWAQTKFADDLYLVPTYQKTIADLSFKALININIQDKEEWTFWIRGVNTQNAAQDYVSFLNEKILLDDISKEDAAKWFDLAVLLGKQLSTIDKLSSSVRNNYGVFATDLTAKAINSELDIDPATFKELVGLLDVSSLRGLTFRWVNPEKAPSDAYAMKLVVLSESLYSRAKELKLGQTALEIERFVSARLSPVMATQNAIEGNYKLVGKDKRNWIFTIIRESEQRLIAALCDEQGVICFSFFNVQYDLQRNVFFASENLPSDDMYQNTPIQITFGENKSIKIDLPYAFRVGTTLTGAKTEDYENIMALTDFDAVAIEGRYKGTIEFASGPKKFDLLISTFGEYSIGRLDSEDGYLRIDLNKANDGKIGYIYLTSGRNKKGTWFHLRLKQNGWDDLSGFAVSGGMGKLGNATFTRYYGDDE